MGEVDVVCDAVTILHAGRVVWDGTLAQLRAEAPAPAFRLRTSDDARAVDVATGVAVVETDDGLFVTAERDALDRLVLDLAAAGIAVRGLEEVVSSVESLFLSLTEGR
jgi:ABC-type uncharacterized transport system ATPase subunit